MGEHITVTLYNKEHVHEQTITLEQLPKVTQHNITWVRVNELHKNTVDHICKWYNIHPLIIEDILHPNQRTKIEDYDDHIYFVTKWFNKNTSEQISIVLSHNIVLVFTQKTHDIFGHIQEKILQQESTIRKKGADYLFYELIDEVVDQYYRVIDEKHTKIIALEETVLENYSDETIKEVYTQKRQILALHRHIWPMREVTNTLLRNEHKHISEHTKIYIRDVHDHVMHAIDNINVYQEMLTGLIDLCMTQTSNKMNEVMKVLTITGTIFIPLTFVAGIYGMNFEYMPELGWKLGYPGVLIIMTLMAATMVAYFKHKKWI